MCEAVKAKEPKRLKRNLRVWQQVLLTMVRAVKYVADNAICFVERAEPPDISE